MKYRILLLILIGFMCSNQSTAQVDLAIKYITDGTGVNDSVKVFMRSVTTRPVPQNTVSNAQITIKAPTGAIPDITSIFQDFTVLNRITLFDNGGWEPNARFDNPPSQPGYDFVSFGLSDLGTRKMEMQAGVEIGFHFPAFRAADQNGIVADLINILIAWFWYVLLAAGPLPDLGPHLVHFLVEEVLVDIAVVGYVRV